VRNPAGRLGLNKNLIWQLRMLAISIIESDSAASFSDIVEADETYQRGSRNEAFIAWQCRALLG
jgi:hypothetical protein